MSDRKPHEEVNVPAPVGHGPLDISVNFNEEPPVYFKNSFERDVVFSTNSGGFSEISGKSGRLQTLPELDGLYGLALYPKSNYYHNFLYAYSFNGLMYDNDRIIDGVLHDDKSNFVTHFGWKISNGLYREVVEGKIIYPPLIDGFEYAMGREDGTTDYYNESRQRCAKWGYKLKSVPINSFAVDAPSAGGLSTGDATPTKLVPWQTQLQGAENGPTGIGVHWCLEKLIPIPGGLGFYLDIYTEKDVDDLTSTIKIFERDTEGSKYRSVILFDNRLQKAFMENGDEDDSWDNSAVFTGDADEITNSAFYLVNKSYIIVQIGNVSPVGDCFFILITSDSNPKLFQVYGGDKKLVKMLSEYKPDGDNESTISCGKEMMLGVNGHLRIQVRQLGRHLLIENNVFTKQWVIGLSPFVLAKIEQDSADGKNPESENDIILSGDVNYNLVGGNIKVFGGNISCGISFCHLNYYPDASIDLKEKKVFSADRTFYSYLSSAGAGKIPQSLKTNTRFYPNIAQMITDHNGSATLETRPGCKFGGYGGKLDERSKLEIHHESTPNGKYSNLSSSITLNAGIASSINKKYGDFNYGYCITPVLQFCRQSSPMVTTKIKTDPIDIADIVETIEITREAQDYHAVSASGSMTLNIYSPSYNSEARNAVIQSIGKARYLTINGSHFNCAKDIFQAYRSGDAPGGKINFGYSGDADREIFSGIAFNPNINEEAGKRTLKFELKDFWTILESKLIINSPYFDGKLDTSVIKALLDTVGIINQTGVHTDSRDTMPISFNFNEPSAKFADRTTVADAIKKLAKKYSKCAFFNTKGRFCYQQIPGTLLSGSSILLDGPADVKFTFYSSHKGDNINIQPIGKYQPINKTVPGHNSQIAYNVKTTQWNNSDIFNKLMILSVDAKNRGIILISDTNYDSLTNSDSFGFLGYERTFIQDEAAFGDYERTQKIIRYYTRMFQPTYSINWKCIGGNTGVDIFDMVAVDDALVVITKISHTIDAKNNLWETEYSGEWIYPPMNTGNYSEEIK